MCSNLYAVQHNTDNHSFYINVGAITAAKSWRRQASPNQRMKFLFEISQETDIVVFCINSVKQTKSFFLRHPLLHSCYPSCVLKQNIIKIIFLALTLLVGASLAKVLCESTFHHCCRICCSVKYSLLLLIFGTTSSSSKSNLLLWNTVYKNTLFCC